MTGGAGRVGAFFDIDGTLLAAPSLEWRFVSWLAARDLLNGWQVAGWAAGVLPALLCRERAPWRKNKTHLAGLPSRLIANWEASLDREALAPLACGAARLGWHLEQGHRVFLVSGTLAPLARVFAVRLGGAIEMRATELEFVDGICTGFIKGTHVSGAEKARVVLELAERCGLRLADSYAYGNHLDDDVAMLEAVGHGVAVNPGRRLKRIAEPRGWGVEDWTDGTKGGTACVADLIG
jgi:HAD superfamily hydrolase (TIGR01490 family)